MVAVWLLVRGAVGVSVLGWSLPVSFAPSAFLLVLPASVSSVLAAASSVGFGGCRVPSSFCLPVAWSCVSVLLGSSPSSVFVSCGSGVPALVAGAFGLGVGAPSFFSRCAFPGPAPLPRRAAALCRGLAAAPSPLFVCCPVVAPPAAVSGAARRRSWVSCGSGSWSECSLSRGLGVPVLLFLPSGVLPPAAWGCSLLGVSGGGSWFLAPAPVVAPPVLSLFPAS